jgi:nucleotide-binding universal stress UspA family protein
MASRGPDPAVEAGGAGPVLFGYDGCELAGMAIEAAGRQLASGREAVVLCVWRPVDVGFLLPAEKHVNTADAQEVRRAAQETAAQGAELAAKAGFRAESAEVEASPTWKGIVQFAEAREISLAVFGAHRHGALAGHLLGSVTADVLRHSSLSVLVVRGPDTSLR